MDSYVRALDCLWQQHLTNIHKVKTSYSYGFVTLQEVETYERNSLEMYNNKKAKLFHQMQSDKVRELPGKKKIMEGLDYSYERFRMPGIGLYGLANVSELTYQHYNESKDYNSCDSSISSINDERVVFSNISLNSQLNYVSNDSIVSDSSDFSADSTANKKKLTKGATRRNQYPMAFKLRVIEEYDRIVKLGGVTNVQEKVAVSMDVSQSLVSKWVKARGQLQGSLSDVTVCTTIRTRKRKSADIDEFSEKSSLSSE